MTFLAHCDTKYLPEEAVFAAPEVEGTATWKPVHHRELITSLNASVNNAGMVVEKRQYSLSNDGGRMFGLWQLGAVNTDMAYMVGIRNSTNRTLSIGLACGTNVFVCDNLAFSGELVQFRRHTKNVINDLQALCDRAILQIATKVKAFADWHRSLKQYTLREVQAELLTMQAMRRGVISGTDLAKVEKLFFDRQGVDCKFNRPDLYCWHGAVTEILRDRNIYANFYRNAKLTKLCKEFIARYGQRM